MPTNIVLSYNATWNHFAGNDSGTDTITEDSVTKVVPPRVENWIAATPGATPLTLTYTATPTDVTGKKYTYSKPDSFRWVSSDEEIATVKVVDVDGVRTGEIELSGNKFGEVTFTFVCKNGKHPVALTSARLYVSDSPDPYLYVPQTSSLVTTRVNLGACVNFASNLAQRNANAAYESKLPEAAAEAGKEAYNAVIEKARQDAYDAAIKDKKSEEEANSAKLAAMQSPETLDAANAAKEKAIAETTDESKIAAARKAANATETAFTLDVYAVDANGDKTGSPVYTKTEKASLSNPIRFFFIPEGQLTKVSAKTGMNWSYVAEISAVYKGDALSMGIADNNTYEKQQDGTWLFNTKATAKIQVREPVATVTITRPQNPRKNEESSFVLDSDNPTISWSTTGKDTHVEITDEEGKSYQASGGSYTFPKVPEGKLKNTYTVTVYATNDEDLDGWTVASAKMYVYNGDALDLLVYSSGYGNGEHTEEVGTGENRKLVDGSGKPLDSAKVDNRRWLKSMLSGDGKTLDLAGHNYSLLELQNDVNLSAAITLNFGEYAWGMIADQIEWKAEKAPEDTGVLYYHQATQYVDVDDLALNSVFPTAEMIAMGKENGKITVTATHAGTGQETSVQLDYNNVTDEFYMFQFFPKAKTTVTYINGKGVEVTVDSDNQGQLALLEPDSIDDTTPIYLRSITDVTEKDSEGNDVTRKDVLFIGMIEPGDVLTGEADAIENERYPVNVHHLSEPGKVQIYLQKPDKTPLDKGVEVTYRGGAFYGDEPYTYAPKADIFEEKNRTARNLEDENLSNGLHDNKQKTDSDGALTFYFNLDQITGGVDSIDISKEFLYVFEVQVPDYLPFVLRVDPYRSTVTQVLRNEQSEREISVAQNFNWACSQINHAPITNAIMVKRGKEVEYAPLSGDSSLIGNNGQYQTAVLEYETLLWNDKYKSLMSEDANTKQWSITGSTNLNQWFYDPGANTKLGKGYTERREKQTSEVWCFPFSSWPLITASLTMDPEAFGVNEYGSSTYSTWLPQYDRTRSNVYLKDGNSVLKHMNFEYYIFNGTGMLEPINSANAMRALQHTIDGIEQDINDFNLASKASGNSEGTVLAKTYLTLADHVMAGTSGFTMEPYFAATLDPTVYYVFLNFRPTLVQRSFSLINRASDIGGSGADYYIQTNSKEHGVKPSYGEYQKMFDKMKQPKDDYGKVVGLDTFARQHKPISFSGGGALLLRAEFDPATASWKTYYVSGTVDSFTQIGLSVGFTPIPMFVIRVGGVVGADKLFKAQSRFDTNNIQRYDLIRQLSVGGGIQVFGGTGFAAGAFETAVGFSGSIKYTYSNAKLNSSLYRAVDRRTDLEWSKSGSNHTLTGMLGCSIEASLGIVTVSYTICSHNFTITDFPTEDYKTLRKVWEGKATVLNEDGEVLGGKYTAKRSGDNITLQLEVQSPNLRTMLRSVGDAQSLWKTYKKGGPKNIVLGDDGTIFFLDDHVASWADKDGKSNGSIVDVTTPLMDSNTVADFGHSYLDASGSGNHLFAVWSTQTQESGSETGMGSKVEITPQDVAAALKSSEISVAYYNGSEWTKQNLTTNTNIDILPKVASNGNNAVVVWQQAESSGASSAKKNASIFDAAEFDVDSRIMMSTTTDGTTWSEPKTLFSTAAVGDLGNMDLALLNNSTAIVAYTLGSDDNKDVYYSIVNLGTSDVTSYCASSDNANETNVQVQSVGGNEAVLAWYSEQTSETAVTGDIHLLGVNANGTLDKRIPESIGVDGEAEVVGGFRLGGDSLNGLTVAWPLNDEVPEGASVGSGVLYGVQLYSDDDKTVVSPVQRLKDIKSGKNISVNGFEMLAKGQKVTTVLEEKDYTAGKKQTYKLDSGEEVEIPVGSDKLEKKSGSFTDTLEVSDPVYSEELVAPNSELPVSYTVRNHGVHKITKLTLNGKQKDVTLYPGESTVLTETISFGSNVVDQNYTIKAASNDGSYTDASGTIRFNNPNISVQEVSVREVSLNAEAGKRTVDVTLGNAAGDTLPIGKGKTLTVQLFSDMEGEHPITDAKTVNSSNYGRINNSSVTVDFNTTVDDVFKSLGQTGKTSEIPESGLPIFAIAQVKDGDTVLSTSVNMTSLKPMSVHDEGEGDVEVRTEAWKQDKDEGAQTNTVKVGVSFNNSSLKSADKPKYTHVKVFDERGLLLAEHFKKNSGSVKAESIALDEITVNLPMDKTVSLITAEAQEEIDYNVAPAAAGYYFNAWYSDTEYKEQFKRETEKDENGRDKRDDQGNLIYVPITVDEDKTFTVYPQWTVASSGGSTANPVPVTGESTVRISAQIKDGNATLGEITQTDLNKVTAPGANGKVADTITIDLSGAPKDVDTVVLSKETIKNLTDAVEKNEGVKNVTVKLNNISVAMDETTLKAIAEKADGSTISLAVKAIDQSTLNAQQQTALSAFGSAVVFETYIGSNGKRISDFNGGVAIVSCEFPQATGTSVDHYHLVDLNPDVTVEYLKTWFVGDTMYSEVTNMSQYAVVYDATRKNATATEPDPQPEPEPVNPTPTNPAYADLTEAQQKQAETLVKSLGVDAKTAANLVLEAKKQGISVKTLQSQTNELAKAAGVDAKTAALMVLEAKKLGVSMDTMKLTGASLKKLDVDSKEAKGTGFSKLTARATKRSAASETLQWKKVKGASGYLIYGNKCGKNNKMKLLKTVKGNKTFQWTQKGLKKGTYYKYMVVAYKTVNKKKMPIAASVTVHAATMGGRFTIAKAVKVTQGKKEVKAVTVKIKKTVTIKGTEVKEEAKKTIKQHRGIKYESSNKKIATVSAKGVITGKKKGTATIFVYAQNGLYKTVKVTVK